MKSVFLVDTSSDDRQAIRSVFGFERYEYKVTGEYSSVEEAMAALSVTVPDLVVTDISFPGRSGLDLAGLIHNTHPGTDVILVSRYQDFTAARLALRLRVRAYLLKPLVKGEVFSIMNDLVMENKTGIQEGEPDDLVGRAMLYIESNYATSFTLDDVAAFLQVNRNYLSDAFSKRSGMTFTAYKNTTRLQHAKGMIREGSRSMSEIASLVGFESSSRFSKVFRQMENMTPQQYKALYLRELNLNET